MVRATKNSRAGNGRGGSRLKVLAIRVGLWTAVVLGAVLVGWGLLLGVRRVFFSGNPHYALRRIQFERRTGTYEEETVRRLLSEAGVVIGESNVQALDLAALRQAIEADVLVQRAEVRRELPDTLVVTVFARTPVAQLLTKGGRLVDEDGVIMPPSARREPLSLPIITGITGLPDLPTGRRIDHPMLQSALVFLKQKAVTRNGNWLDVQLVQLAESSQALRVYVRGNDQLFLRDNAVFIFPSTNVAQALVRALEIVQERSRAGQWISKLDATYDKIPVEP